MQTLPLSAEAQNPVGESIPPSQCAAIIDNSGVAAILKELRSQRRAKTIFQIGAIVLPILLTVAFTIGPNLHLGPWHDSVAIVRIEGVIDAHKPASADELVPVLKSAFENSSVKAVVLSIESPGGAPVESERINDAISGASQETPEGCDRHLQQPLRQCSVPHCDPR